MVTDVQTRPVDTRGDADDDPNHVACDRLNVTWCGQDASDLVACDPEAIPPLETFCRVCILAVEMHGGDGPCPMCGSVACLG